MRGVIEQIRLLNCLYCENPPDRNAHVMLAAIGGRFKSHSTECKKCNNELGNSIERKVAEELRPLTGQLGIRRDNGRFAPPAIATIDGVPYFLRRGGAYRKGWAREERIREDGKRELNIFTKWKENKDGSFGLDWRGTAVAVMHEHRRKTVYECRVVPGGGRNRTDLGTYELCLQSLAQKRAIAKMALELLAHHRPWYGRNPVLRPLRDFVGTGQREWDVMLDLHTPGTGLLPEEMPQFANSIEVWSAGRLLVGRVVLLGMFPFTLTLSRNWTLPPVLAVYAVDPIEGRDVLSPPTKALEIDLSATTRWGRRRPPTHEELARLKRAMENKRDNFLEEVATISPPETMTEGQLEKLRLEVEKEQFS